MSNLIDHAKVEFRAAGWTDENGKFNDEMQEDICKHVLKLLDVFADEGHSGFSAPYAIDLFKRLAMFKPIAPLTGEDWEWSDTGHDVYQNRRCSSVFKNKQTGKCYDIDGKVFWEWHISQHDGEPYKSYYHSGGCHTPVTFPYTPPTKRVEVYRYSDAIPLAPPQTEEGIL